MQCNLNHLVHIIQQRYELLLHTFIYIKFSWIIFYLYQSHMHDPKYIYSGKNCFYDVCNVTGEWHGASQASHG